MGADPFERAGGRDALHEPDVEGSRGRRRHHVARLSAHGRRGDPAQVQHRLSDEQFEPLPIALRSLTKEVVEAARENLVAGQS